MVNIIIDGRTKVNHEEMEEIKHAAIGRKAENGPNLEILKIRYKNRRGSVNQRFSTKGYQDVEIKMPIEGTMPIITYGLPGHGSLCFICTKRFGFEGELPKTEHNINMLAAHYYQGWYEFLDKELEKEIKTIADKNDMRDYTIEENMKLSPWEVDKDPAYDQNTKQIKQRDNVIESLRKELNELKGIKKEEKLEDLSIQKLRQLANKKKILIFPTDSKRIILEKLNENKGDDKLHPEEGEQLHKAGIA